jgi:hypothetical protein
MLRFNFMLTERNRKMLEQSVRVTGLSYSETIRRLLDEHLVLQEEDEVDEKNPTEPERSSQDI